MDIGDIANEWLGNVPIGSLYSVGEAANDWLYTLTPGDFLPSSRPPLAVPTLAPTPTLARSDYQGENPDARPLIRITRSTPMDYSDPRYSYVDPIQRLAPENPNYVAPGALGYVDPAGPFAGYNGPVPVYALSDWAQASQQLFSPLALRSFSLPPLRFPGTQPATQQAASPRASWTSWLLYGGLALAAVLLLKR